MFKDFNLSFSFSKSKNLCIMHGRGFVKIMKTYSSVCVCGPTDQHSSFIADVFGLHCSNSSFFSIVSYNQRDNSRRILTAAPKTRFHDTGQSTSTDVCHRLSSFFAQKAINRKVKVGNHQEIGQSERNSHSKNRGGKN